MIFLAGPMKGSAETDEGLGWQFEAAEIIEAADPSIWVATPRMRDGFSTETNFEMLDQVRWEALHLARAAFHGAQLYWYAEQGEEVERRSSEFVRPYAKTTNKELFEWWTKKITHAEIQLVLGAHPSTSNLGYERARMDLGMPDIPELATDLEQLCLMAVDLAQSSEPIDNFAFWGPDNPYNPDTNMSGDLSGAVR